MESIRIKGLKCLHDTGDFELKKINILIGINSSGKSTFLRTFPLIRQSVERKTRGPILWSGHYIDFGTFENSIFRNSESSAEEKLNDIEFSFTMNYEKLPTQVSTPISFSISITKPKNSQNSYTHRYCCTLNDHSIHFNFDENGTITDISSEVLTWELKKSDYKFQVTDTDTLLPILRPDNMFFAEAKQNQLLTTLRNQAINLFKEYAGSTSDNKSSELFSRITRKLTSNTEKLRMLQSAAMTIKWKKKITEWDESDGNFCFLAGLIDLYCIIEHSPRFNNALTEEFLGVRYIAPLRTSTQRYYRYQDINIDELDHQGENIGMFLSNIPKVWKDNLDKWTESEFGFVISDQNLAGHTSINIMYTGSTNTDNMSDMGFGYSQFLPIIIQLWSISSGYENSTKKVKTRNYILAIEQPELHLHPKLQAELASIFVKSIKLADDSSISLKMIIETHSESIISKTSQLIVDGKINNTDIGIHCFEQNIKSRKSKIKKSNFTEKGTLENWPLGFFEHD